MKITKQQLKQIIKEELENLSEASDPTDSLVAVLRKYYPEQLADLQSAVAQIDATVEVLDEEMRKWDPKSEPDEQVRAASNALNKAADNSNRRYEINYDQSFMLAARKANESPPPALQEDKD